MKRRRRCGADQPAHRLRGFFAAPEPGAAQREDAIGKDEVPVAFDRLAGMRDGFFGAAGQETSQRKG